MYCEKCKKSFLEVADGVCPICGESLAKIDEQTPNSELLCAIERLKQGNQDGFPTIYEHTYKFVCSRAKTLCDDPEDIPDVVQEAYALLVQNVASLRSNESIFAWLRTVTYHVSSRILKKKKYETLLAEENEEWLESLPDEGADAENDFVNQQDVEIIRGCVNRLPDGLRAVVLAYYYDNLKVEEIAQLLNIPVGTVKSRLFISRKKIKQYIEEEERRLGYKLHSFSAVPLLMAIRSLLQENVVDCEAQSAIMYTRVCSELNLSVGSGATATSVAGTLQSTNAVKTAVRGIFKKTALGSACKAVIAVVCGVAVIATATFAGERLMRKRDTATSNDILANRTSQTTGQQYDSETTISSSMRTTYTSTIVPTSPVVSTTTTTIATTNNTTITTAVTANTSSSPSSQMTTSTTAVATPDYDPDPTHEPPQPGDVYETKDYIYRYQWCDSGSEAEFDPANIDTSIGWSVVTKNQEQTEYEALFDAIYGEPVTTMFYTYNMCCAMTIAPAVPKYITDMSFAYTNTSISVAPVLPETVTALGYAFAGTLITETPIIPTNVKSLMHTFQGCQNLKTAPVIPDSVVNMWGTFSGCSSLVSAPVIPENVCDLTETFLDCSSLTGTVTINSTEVNYNISWCFEGTEKPITLTGSTTKEILLALAETSYNNNITVN